MATQVCTFLAPAFKANVNLAPGKSETLQKWLQKEKSTENEQVPQGTRVKTIQEQLRVVEKISCFEITALFPSPTHCGEKGGKFKTRKFFNYPGTFLYCLYSSSHCSSS